MHPILFAIGPVTIYSYGLMLALAVLACAYLLSRDARRLGISPDFVYDFFFICVLWGLIGARLGYILLYLSYFLDNPLEIFMLQNGGLAWQGGFLGGTLAGVWFVKRRGMSIRQWLDLTAPYIALGQAIGRVGCFFNGCCYGKPAAWGIYFPVHHDRLHPTQLYEVFGLLAAFFILKWAASRPHLKGHVFVLYLWLAAIERFTVEFFRADHDGLFAGLSFFQWTSLGIFAAGIVFFMRFKK